MLDHIDFNIYKTLTSVPGTATGKERGKKIEKMVKYN